MWCELPARSDAGYCLSMIVDAPTPIILHVLTKLREAAHLASVTQRTFVLAAAGFVLCSTNVFAQRASALDLGTELRVGGEAERYVRAMQLLGWAAPSSWTIRANLPTVYAITRQADSLPALAHPWQSRFSNDRGAGRQWSITPLRPNARLIYNSSFPLSTSDGPTWAGRGITGEIQAGVAASLVRLRVQFAPVLFLAENQPFTLAPNAKTGIGAFQDARYPNLIDAPQRFGSKAYGRFDAGNSYAYADLPGAVIGISTAAESWGPAREYALILGGSSGGFTHAFVGTKQPINLWLFSVHSRIVLGELEQSEFSPIDTAPKKRWASAMVLTIVPRGATGLELGVTRFVEAALDGTPGLTEAKRIFSGFDVNTYSNIIAENQLASAFFRWAFPGAGLEFYGEYGKEDYALDVRRLLQYPDDLRAYVLGLQHVTQHGLQRMRTLRFELVNAELSSASRGERGDLKDHKLLQPYPPYLHGIVTQGHTNRGLFLGSPEAFGGAAWRAGLDQFTAAGRTSYTIERNLRMDWVRDTATFSGASHPDVQWSAGAERMRFAGKRDYTVSVLATMNFNRNLQASHNVFNVRAALSVRGLRR